MEVLSQSQVDTYNQTGGIVVEDRIAAARGGARVGPASGLVVEASTDLGTRSFS